MQRQCLVHNNRQSVTGFSHNPQVISSQNQTGEKHAADDTQTVVVSHDWMFSFSTVAPPIRLTQALHQQHSYRALSKKNTLGPTGNISNNAPMVITKLPNENVSLQHNIRNCTDQHGPRASECLQEIKQISHKKVCYAY